MNRSLIFMTLVLLSCSAQSEPNFWKCEVEDSTQETWADEHPIKRIAMNLAYSQCKKASVQPHSCRAARSGCTYYVNGIDTTPLWRCMALDQMSVTWYSNPYPLRDDAVLAARAYCQQRSGFPDTCYVNLLTCKSH